MKRVVPEEVIKARFWLLAEKRFDEANTMADIISCMESGIRLDEQRADLFKRVLIDYKRSQGTTGLGKKEQVYEYFTKRYGLKNAHFIMSRLEAGINRYSLDELISMGDKLALFNGWVRIEDL